VSSIGAMAVFNEVPSVFGGLGIALIIGGIVLIAGGTSILRSNNPRTARGVFYGVLTGLCISAYTINDAYAVKSLLISPIVFQYLENSTRVIVLAPVALRKAAFASELKRTWRLALGVGFLVPISYILALYAMRLAPVSYIAPARGERTRGRGACGRLAACAAAVEVFRRRQPGSPRSADRGRVEGKSR